MSRRSKDLKDSCLCSSWKFREKVSEKQKIIADLKKLEEKHITKEQFYLPDVIRQGRLLPAENESQIPAILFLGIAVIIFSGITKMKNIRNKEYRHWNNLWWSIHRS